ncbi:MAG: hypothetical protein ABW321_22475, partial [Polyangiales bacterium]
SAWPLRLLGMQHALFGLCLGLPGLLAALMWAFTEHTVTYHNENLLLANPLTFALCPLGIAMALGAPRAFRWARLISYALVASSLLLVVLKVLPMFNQDTSLPLSVLLPANVGLFLAHRKLARREDWAALRVNAQDRMVSRA